MNDCDLFLKFNGACRPGGWKKNHLHVLSLHPHNTKENPKPIIPTSAGKAKKKNTKLAIDNHGSPPQPWIIHHCQYLSKPFNLYQSRNPPLELSF